MFWNMDGSHQVRNIRYLNAMHGNALRYAAIVAFGGFVFGIDAALISGTVGYITTEFSLSDLQIGTVVSASGFGVLFALLAVGYVADLLGRKKTLQIIAAMYLISAIGSALAPSYWTLVCARFLGGLAFTSITLSAMYIGEIAPPKQRGRLVAINQINIVVGLSAAYFINYLILQLSHSDARWVTQIGLDRHTWRWMLGIEVVPAVLWSVMLLFIPPSPRWLLLRGDENQARDVLHKLLPTEEVEPQLQGMLADVQQNQGQASARDQLRSLLDKSLRLAVIVSFVYAVVQQITGINAVLFYAPTVFEQLGVGTDAAFMQAVWVGLAGFVFTVGAIVLVDRIGRRILTLTGLAWAILSLAICAYGFQQATYQLDRSAVISFEDIGEKLQPMVGVLYEDDVSFKAALRENLGESTAKEHEANLFNKAADLPGTLILIGIISFVAAFHFSIGPIMWVIFSELFPTRVRGVAIPAFALVTSLVSYLVQKFFPWQLTHMGARDIFLFYAVTGLIGFLLLLKYLPETKNKTIEEIAAELA